MIRHYCYHSENKKNSNFPTIQMLSQARAKHLARGKTLQTVIFHRYNCHETEKKQIQVKQPYQIGAFQRNITIITFDGMSEHN